MSLDKAIASGKEYRKPYHGGKAVSTRCRNHGWCDVCEGNRLYKFRDRHPPLEEELNMQLEWVDIKRTRERGFTK